MKKIFTLCLLVCSFFVNKSTAQDGEVPFSGIRNTVDDAKAQVNVREFEEEEDVSGDMMLTTTCDSLLTTMAGGNGHRGNMFNVTALSALTITKFDIHLDSFKISNERVYYHTGSYFGTENNPSAWTLIGYRDSVHAKPPHRPTPLTIPINVTIPIGQTCSFYITSTVATKNNNYTNGTQLGAVYAQNPDMLIFEGCAIDYPFSGTPFAPRKWNGRIHYCLEPVGIAEEIENAVSSFVAPNPVTTTSTLYINAKTQQTYSLKFFDVLGNTVNEINNISTNEVKIEKGKLSEGVYIYKLYNKQNTVAKGKLIIQ